MYPMGQRWMGGGWWEESRWEVDPGKKEKGRGGRGGRGGRESMPRVKSPISAHFPI